MPHSWFSCEFFLFVVVFRNSNKIRTGGSASLSDNDSFTSRSSRNENRSLKVSCQSIIGMSRRGVKSWVFSLFLAAIIFRNRWENLWKASRHFLLVLESCSKPFESANV